MKRPHDGPLGTVILALVFAILVAILAITFIPRAYSAERDYLMRGIGGRFITDAVDRIADRERTAGHSVTLASWTDWRALVADAHRHPHDQIVCIGHSAGGDSCIKFARAFGRPVRVVTIDPTHLAEAAPRNATVTNFYRPFSLVGGGTVIGARNIPLSGYGHIGIAADPRVQTRVLRVAN